MTDDEDAVFLFAMLTPATIGGLVIVLLVALAMWADQPLLMEAIQ